MELWVAFGFGAAVGALIGYLLGRQREVPAPPLRARPTPAHSPAPALPPTPKAAPPPDLTRVVLDEGSANVLNALNNRLAAIGGLADLLHGSPLDPERARALVLLHGEVRRAAEITSHFLDLAANPAGAAEPCDAGIVISGVLAERESTFRELGVKVHRQVPADLPMVAIPMVQLTEMLTKLLDFSLRRLRGAPAQPPRELRLEAIATGPSVVVSLWDSGTPLAVEAEQRLTSPFRFTQSGGGGEVEFALARALAQSAGGSLRLRPRGGGAGAEVVVTLPRSLLGAQTPLATAPENLPRMRILVVDDDAVNRQAMVLLLEREGHQVVSVENGVEAMDRLGERDTSFDAIVTDLQMPRLGGRAMYEQLVNGRPLLAKRFVFVTGDQARGETRAFLDNCGQPSVTKPYDLGDLINAIGTVARKK